MRSQYSSLYELISASPYLNVSTASNKSAEEYCSRFSFISAHHSTLIRVPGALPQKNLWRLSGWWEIILQAGDALPVTRPATPKNLKVNTRNGQRFRHESRHFPVSDRDFVDLPIDIYRPVLSTFRRRWSQRTTDLASVVVVPTFSVVVVVASSCSSVAAGAPPCRTVFAVPTDLLPGPAPLPRLNRKRWAWPAPEEAGPKCRRKQVGDRRRRTGWWLGTYTQSSFVTRRPVLRRQTRTRVSEWVGFNVPINTL